MRECVVFTIMTTKYHPRTNKNSQNTQRTNSEKVNYISYVVLRTLKNLNEEYNVKKDSTEKKDTLRVICEECRTEDYSVRNQKDVYFLLGRQNEGVCQSPTGNVLVVVGAD